MIGSERSGVVFALGSNVLFHVPGHGAAAGTTNLVGTFKSPKAALYSCRVKKTAFHSF